MSCNHSISSKSIVITEVDERDCLKTSDDAPNESPFLLARASKKRLDQEAESSDAWTEVLKDWDHKDADVADEDIDIEDEESNRDLEWAQTT